MSALSLSDKIDDVLDFITSLEPLSPSASQNTYQATTTTIKEHRRKLKAAVQFLDKTAKKLESRQPGESSSQENEGSDVQQKAKKCVDGIMEDIDPTILCLYSPTQFHLWKDWRTQLFSLTPTNYSWDTMCQDSTANDHTNTGVDLLFFTQRFLKDLEKKLSGLEGGKALKTAYIQAVFKDVNKDTYQRMEHLGNQSVAYCRLNQSLKTKLKSFRDMHEHVVVNREDVLQLYESFGPIVLMDPAWNTIQAKGKPKARTVEFHETVKLLCDTYPNFDKEVDENIGNQEVPIAVTLAYLTLVSLYRILKCLASQTVASYVCKFVIDNPPRMPNIHKQSWTELLEVWNDGHCPDEEQDDGDDARISTKHPIMAFGIALISVPVLKTQSGEE
ncbi:hypothetical protein H0H93_002407 [Arthromyces matolae]|nr:hypothetical protein H0H93_002407 [Arthromyces matolae]